MCGTSRAAMAGGLAGCPDRSRWRASGCRRSGTGGLLEPRNGGWLADFRRLPYKNGDRRSRWERPFRARSRAGALDTPPARFFLPRALRRDRAQRRKPSRLTRLTADVPGLQDVSCRFAQRACQLARVFKSGKRHRSPCAPLLPHPPRCRQAATAATPTATRARSAGVRRWRIRFHGCAQRRLSIASLCWRPTSKAVGSTQGIETWRAERCRGRIRGGRVMCAAVGR